MDSGAFTPYPEVGVRDAFRWALGLLAGGVLTLLPIGPYHDDLFLLTLGGALCFSGAILFGWQRRTLPVPTEAAATRARAVWYAGAGVWTVGWCVMFATFLLALPPGPYSNLTDPHPVEAVTVLAGLAALVGRVVTIRGHVSLRRTS